MPGRGRAPAKGGPRLKFPTSVEVAGGGTQMVGGQDEHSGGCRRYLAMAGRHPVSFETIRPWPATKARAGAVRFVAPQQGTGRPRREHQIAFGLLAESP